MAIGTLFGTNTESVGLYGTPIGGTVPSNVYQTYFEWFIFKESSGQPATPTGGSWDFSANVGTPPTGWTSTIATVPLNTLWMSIAFVDSRNPTVLLWSAPGLLSDSSVYATCYADTFTGDGTSVDWTLTTDPVTVLNLDVSINGVTQVPTTDYTVSGTTFTTTTAAPLGAVILVKYQQSLALSYYGAASNVQFTPVGTISATNVQSAIAEILTDFAASSGSSLVGYLPAGTGAVSTTVQAKLRESVSVLDFGADPTGVADSTAEIQAAMDAAYLIRLPTGTYKVSTLEFNHDNCVLVGDGQKATYVVSTITSGTAFWNPLQATTTRLYCGIEGMQITAPNISSAGAMLIDWRSMQFGTLKKLWLFGNSYTGLTGIQLGAITWGVTECTYNKLDNLYIGGCGYGIKFFDGANSNYFVGIRVQPPTGSYAYHLAFATAAGRISNNVFVKCDAEYPGNVSTGFALGMGSDNTVIIGSRFEGLATGINVTVDAIKTALFGNYYDSCTTNVSNSSTSITAVDNGTFKPTFAADYGYDLTSYGFNSKRNRFLQTNGGSEVWLNDASNGLKYLVYGSTYGGGTGYAVGQSGGILEHAGGALAIATSDSYPIKWGTNGATKMQLETSGSLTLFSATTASAPAYVKGSMYFDTTLNKLRIGGATGWETVTSV